MKSVLTSLAVLAGLAVTHPAAAAEPLLVVYDNDFYGPTNSDLLPLIGNPTVKLLGITAVSGDAWRDEGAALALRSLELYHHAEIPVYLGAVDPLVNSEARTRAWEQTYGKFAWKGAWNPDSMGKNFHAAEPYKIPDLEEGKPATRPQTEGAVQFLIRTVHEHPHQVTVIAAGPLTNLALAQRLDPEFAGLAKELVFMGALIGTNLGQVSGSADFNSDFNITFDPEAAHIVFTAPWARITAVGNVSNDTLATPEFFKELTAKKTAATELLGRHPWIVPMWDELTTALAVDRSLVTKEIAAYMDVDIDHGLNYGIVHVWPEATRPNLGEQKVDIVLAVDKPRFYKQFIKAAQSVQ